MIRVPGPTSRNSKEDEQHSAGETEQDSCDPGADDERRCGSKYVLDCWQMITTIFVFDGADDGCAVLTAVGETEGEQWGIHCRTRCSASSLG